MNFFGDYLYIFNVWPDCGDMIDRLNYHYTAVILMITGLSIAGMLYAKHPVQCWVPAEFIPQVVIECPQIMFQQSANQLIFVYAICFIHISL